MGISFKPCGLLLLTAFISLASTTDLRSRVIAAINCGGSEVLGAYGITYAEDTSEDGEASDHGMQYSFSNAASDDTEIYQTERWSKESFEYEVPAGDGEYVIILKFSEVYFQHAGEKVFNVKINSHAAVKNLDIFNAAGGRGFAHDIYIPVVINGDSISVQGHPRGYNGNIIIELAKGPSDNPKINGFAVVRAKLDQIPPPPQRFVADIPFEEDFDIYESEQNDDAIQPKVIRGDDSEEDIEMYSAAPSESENPFEKKRAQESTSTWLGIVVAFVVIIPLAYLIQLQFGGQP